MPGEASNEQLDGLQLWGPWTVAHAYPVLCIALLLQHRAGILNQKVQILIV